MLIFFSGMAISLIYGLLGSALLFYLGGNSEAQAFFTAYTISFKTIISLGLIIGTALIVFCTQNVIPKTIEAAFGGDLSKDYYYYKGRFESLRISITFSTWFIIAGFIIFSLSQFPLSRQGQALMIIAACTEYALGVYVGRKLIYTGMMMHSLLSVPVTRNLFRRRELDVINPCVNVASTLTVIFVYVHVSSYYEGPFLYGSPAGQSIKLFLLLPAIIATPVLLIFNFYPREVLRNLYNRSIGLEIERLKQTLKNEALSSYEKRSHLIEFKRMSREELSYGLKLTLSDLPIGITILIMVLEPLLKR
jgi:hypothetical protein